MKNLILIGCMISFITMLRAQNENQNIYPKIGKMCPDFTLHNIGYFSQKEATSNNFRGKWLVLDFWNKFCGSCVESFPKVSQRQKIFGEKVQFMMVAIQDPEGQIEPMYARFREKENLIMPCAFDSLLANQWGIGACPHIIIIDDKGIVQGITASLDSEQIQGFLNGEHPDLFHVFDPGDTVDHRISFDNGKPFLLNNNGGIDSEFLFRSILSRVNLSKQQSFAPEKIDESVNTGRFQVVGVPLLYLYNYAYFGSLFPGGYVGDSTHGKYANEPILEMKDTSLFKYSYNHNRGLFAYSLIMPADKVTRAGFQKTMQNDLLNYFGYEVRVEYRKFPIWRLVATDEAKAKLKTKGGSEIYKATKTGFTAQNWPFATLLSQLYFGFQKDIIYDETGITGNIDITMANDVWPKAWVNIQDAKKALHACGLELMPDQKEMKVLVIKDKPVSQ
jgi:thiol-disulfide isomerase/thioredoxin